MDSVIKAKTSRRNRAWLLWIALSAIGFAFMGLALVHVYWGRPWYQPAALVIASCFFAGWGNNQSKRSSQIAHEISVAMIREDERRERLDS